MLSVAMMAALALAAPPAALPGAHSSGESYPIKVYFWRQSPGAPAAVTPVRRRSPDLQVARYALEQLLAGPTERERAQGLRGGLRDALKGPSNCGQDFTVAIRRGALTVRFCRYVNTTTGTMMQVLPQLNATLRQFPTVRRVILLTRDGHCTFTQRDGDHCLS
ncbi:GerMN domain-containing protein [Actinomadura sp. 9N215]|uniref:GerMN domain-containing protein n=1 Tax=Actinomadura sp. 9N215 TaxID=3375150 RepID=UPI0037903817